MVKWKRRMFMKIGDCSDFPKPVFKENEIMVADDIFPDELLAAVKKGKKWVEHSIITGVTEEMKKTLPKGLKCVNNKIKVPAWPHPLNDKFQEWCRQVCLTDGFSL